MFNEQSIIYLVGKCVNIDRFAGVALSTKSVIDCEWACVGARV